MLDRECVHYCAYISRVKRLFQSRENRLPACGAGSVSGTPALAAEDYLEAWNASLANEMVQQHRFGDLTQVLIQYHEARSGSADQRGGLVSARSKNQRQALNVLIAQAGDERLVRGNDEDGYGSFTNSPIIHTILARVLVPAKPSAMLGNLAYAQDLEAPCGAHAVNDALFALIGHGAMFAQVLPTAKRLWPASDRRRRKPPRFGCLGEKWLNVA
jgi:hypothetical protein